MIKDEWEEMIHKIGLSVNVLKRDIRIHCDEHGGIVTFDFYDGNGTIAQSYEYLN